MLAVACYYLFTLLQSSDDSQSARGTTPTESNAGGETPGPEVVLATPQEAGTEPPSGGDPAATMSFGDAAAGEGGDAAAPAEGDGAAPAVGEDAAAVAPEGDAAVAVAPEGDAAVAPEAAEAGEATPRVEEPVEEPTPEEPPTPPEPPTPDPPVVPGAKRILVINSEPSNAPVSVNGKNIGRTPLTLTDRDTALDQRLRIRLSKVAHDNWDMVIEADDSRWRSSGGQERITLDATMVRHGRRRNGGELEPGGPRPPAGQGSGPSAAPPGEGAAPPPPPPPPANVEDNPYQ